MRIRIPWLPLWLGLVGGSFFAVALRPARRPSPRGWVPARGGAARHPRGRTCGGWLSLNYQPS